MRQLRYLMFLIIALQSINLYAQVGVIQNDTIRWLSSGYSDMLSNAKFKSNGEFITYGGNRVDWIQKNGAKVYELPVRKLSGQWESLDKYGNAEFQVELDGTLGLVRIAKSENGIKLILDFRDLTGGGIYNEYDISSYKIE